MCMQIDGTIIVRIEARSTSSISAGPICEARSCYNFSVEVFCRAESRVVLTRPCQVRKPLLGYGLVCKGLFPR